MKRLAVLPWEGISKIKLLPVFLVRNCLFPKQSHYVKATIVRSTNWKKKVFFLVLVKRTHKNAAALHGYAYSLRTAKKRVDDFLRLHNVTIKTKRDIERLQVMR